MIFLHGLGGDWIETWAIKGRERETFWPAWLAEDLPASVVVWSVEMPTSPTEWRGRSMPIHDIATGLLNRLELEHLGGRPIVLICHSLGGLVAKALIQQAKSSMYESWKKIGGAIRGICFLATPHTGAKLATAIARVVGFVGPFGWLFYLSHSFHDLKDKNKALAKQSDDFRVRQAEDGFEVRVYFEGQRICWLYIVCLYIVDRTSANPDIAGVTPVPVARDHWEICKPEEPGDQVYQGTLALVRRVLEWSNAQVLSVPQVEARGAGALDVWKTINLPALAPERPPGIGRGWKIVIAIAFASTIGLGVILLPPSYLSIFGAVLIPIGSESGPGPSLPSGPPDPPPAPPSKDLAPRPPVQTAEVVQGDSALRTGEEFDDCGGAGWCPRMVVVPVGRFEQGATADERAWYLAQGGTEVLANWEQPRHPVRIDKRFALGRNEVTVGQFWRFVEQTGHSMNGGCTVFDGESWRKDESKSWLDPGFPQTDNHPVVCVSWADAQAYVAWLSTETRKEYRLPSESEWEYAARGSTTPTASMRYWGDDKGNSEACGYANAADQTAKEKINFPGILNCPDGEVYTTAQTDKFRPNRFGLYHMLGNAWEWVEDPWHDSYVGASNDGTVWTSGRNMSSRVLRGGSWSGYPRDLRSADRNGNTPDVRDSVIGFRLARTLTL